MRKENAKSNFAFQMLYQIVTLAIPLIIAPYLTRTLGDSRLGIYTYTYSIMFFFMSFARLGIDKHGQRIVASVRDDNVKLRKTFWSLYYVHVFFTFIAIILYLVFVSLIAKSYKQVYLLQGITLIGVIFDVTWFFYGIENFIFVVLGNLCVKIAELFLIFTLVKSKNDLNVYTVIMSLSMCLGYIVVLPYVLKHVKPIRVGFGDVLQHIKPICILFGAVIATTVYQMIDKALLGVLSTEANVAYYEYANKIVNVPVNLVYVMGTILMPRACAYAARGDRRNQTKYIDYALHFVCFLGVASMFGFFSVSDLFATIYYGEGFSKSGGVMIALAPVIIVLGIENIMRTQYMIPNHMDKEFTGCLLLTTLINLVFSAVLIPVLGVYGSVAGTLIAEGICLIIQIFLCRAIISITRILKILIPYAVSGTIMYIIISSVKCRFNHSFGDLVIQIIIGGFVYCVLCGIYIIAISDIKNQARSEIGRLIRRIKK